MKVALGEGLRIRRRAFLARDQELFGTLPFGSFRKIKDWNDKSMVVIWEGTVEHASLASRYTVRIIYSALYPDRRPHVFPVTPLIEFFEKPTANVAYTVGEV